MLGRLGSQKPVWLEQSEWGWESLGQRNWQQILENLVKWLHTLSCERIRATASCSYSDPILNKWSVLCSDNWIHIVLLLVGGMEDGLGHFSKEDLYLHSDNKFCRDHTSYFPISSWLWTLTLSNYICHPRIWETVSRLSPLKCRQLEDSLVSFHLSIFGIWHRIKILPVFDEILSLTEN